MNLKFHTKNGPGSVEDLFKINENPTIIYLDEVFDLDQFRYGFGPERPRTNIHLWHHLGVFWRHVWTHWISRGPIHCTFLGVSGAGTKTKNALFLVFFIIKCKQEKKQEQSKSMKTTISNPLHVY
jgi:hypothetical protein